MDSSFIDMVSPLSLFPFLLYKAYYLKSFTRLSIISIVKRGVTVITQFWVIPQNSLFFQNKNLKIKQRLATWKKLVREYNCNFRGNSSPNSTLLCQKMEK